MLITKLGDIGRSKSGTNKSKKNLFVNTKDDEDGSGGSKKASHIS